MLSEGYVRWSNLAQNLATGNGIMNNEVYMYIMCFMAFVGKDYIHLKSMLIYTEKLFLSNMKKTLIKLRNANFPKVVTKQYIFTPQNLGYLAW